MFLRRKYIIAGLNECLDANIENFHVHIEKTNNNLYSLLKGYKLLWILEIDFVGYSVTVQ